MQPPLFVILAAGSGKRFKPLVTDKILFPFLGKPFLMHVLETVRDAGGKEVVVVTNHNTDSWLADIHLEGLSITKRQQPNPLGMGDALIQVKNDIGDRPIIVMNGDDIVDVSLLREIIQAAPQAYALVTGKKVDHYFPGGYLTVEGNRVTTIVEKPKPGSEPSDLVNLVIHYFSKPQDFITRLEHLDLETDDHYERGLLSLMKEEQVGFIPYDKLWRTLKFSYHVLDATDFFLDQKLTNFIHPTAQIADSATISGTVYIAEGVRIFEGAAIKGPVYIGKDSIIGDQALVRHSIIETGVTVGFGSEVNRSYVGAGCMLHHNYIGDSVLEGIVNPSWGTTTANLRFDSQPVTVQLPDKKVTTNREKLGAIIAKGAFLGVNCSILPGITIGENARAYPGSVISEPIDANEFYRKS